MTLPVGIAIVGCGFVADYYASNARAWANLEIKGAFDLAEQRLQTFAQYYSLKAYRSLEEVLQDRSVELVLNLTNPSSHSAVTRACFQAGKHVYSEKPLAMDLQDARALADAARAAKVRLGVAPCSLLSPTAQTVWKAIRSGVVGQVRLVCANYDDGRIAPQMHPWLWRSESGAPWPAKDEFETGCTFEHAGYFLTWLAAFFGPARRVTAFSACQIPDKGIRVDKMAPDFSVGSIEYDNGVVARVTCGLIGPKDKSLVVAGDEGFIHVGSLRNDVEPVYVQPMETGESGRSFRSILGGVRHRFKRALVRGYPSLGSKARQYEFAREPALQRAAPDKAVDFCRGVSEMAEAIREDRPHRLSAELGVHVVELIETLQFPERFSRPRVITSTCGEIAPLPWLSSRAN